MGSSLRIRLFLPRRQLTKLSRTQTPFFAKAIDVLKARGHQVEPLEASDEALLRTWSDPGYDLVLDQPPMHDRALTIRQCYFDPFWRIEASEKRWEFQVARTKFLPREVPKERIPRFLKFWGEKLEHRASPTSEGFVYVPLQGKLLSTRSFQSMSPIKMVERLTEAQDRPLYVTLHPTEDYSEPEREALSEICAHPQVTLVTTPMRELLLSCDFVATQNSSVALHGYFYQKPALLFSKIDFHHPASSVPRQGFEKAMASLKKRRPDYGAYLFWFFQMQALNHWRPEFPEQLVTRFQSHGWPV